jgi:protease-4
MRDSRRVLHLLRALLANLLGNLLLIPVVVLRALRRPHYVMLRIEGRIATRSRRHPWWRRRRREIGLDRVADLVERVGRDRKALGLIVQMRRLRGGLADAEALRGVLGGCRRAGKRLVVHLEQGGTPEYFVASVAHEVWMPEGALLDLRGLFVEMSFAGDLLRRLGVHVEVGQAGRYKGAAERLTRGSISPAGDEALRSLFGTFFQRLVETIAEGRRMTPAQVRALIDGGPYDAAAALEAGLIDALAHADELSERLASAGRRRAVLRPAGTYLRRPRLRYHPLRPGRKVVVVELRGTIVSGESSSGLFESIGDRTVRQALERLRRSRRVAAVVLHLDSPGGGVEASELIWRAVSRLAERKPVIAQMGNVAASGGYYLAAPCQAIVAQPTTVTGSIGVLAGKLSFGPLLGRLHLGHHALRFGRRSGMFGYGEALDDEERTALRRLLEVSYERFLDRVAAGRGLPREALQQVAEGRVWSGRDAQRCGLVDRLGGIDDALALARDRGRRHPGERLSVVDHRWPRRPGRRSAAHLGYEALELLLDVGSSTRVGLAGWRLRDEPIWAWLPLEIGR